MTMNVNSRPQKVQAAQQGRVAGLNRVANWILVALMLVPVGLWVTAIVGLRATGILGKALGRWGLTLLVLIFVGPFLCAGFIAFLSALSSLAYRGTSYQMGQMFIALVLAGFLLSWLVAVIAFAVYAWLRRDERARIVWLLLVTWVALGVVLTVTLFLNASPSEWLSFFAVLAYLAGLLALLLFGVGLYVERRRWPGVFVVAIVLLFIPAMISAAALPEMVRTVRLVETLGNPVVYMGPVGWLSGCAPGAPGGGGPSLLNPFPRAMMSAPMPAPTAAAGAKITQETQPQAAGQAPRVRQFFPETLLWVPELKTDASGFAALDVPLADSITTWRVTALASTQDGQLGFSNTALRVFQDFFVDIDLPVALTQNDEVAIPVAVYNYLPEVQNVRLQVKADTWFELQDQSEKSLQIAANDIDVVYFRIKVKQFGEQAFQVTALGDKMSDAIKRSVAVVPDGRLFRKSKSDWLRQGVLITTTVPIESIAGTQRIEVKIYPGVVSQVMEGLEKILRLPHG
jgi:MFS family permease